MDTVQILLMGFISVVIVNNLVFTKFLGICPYLGVSGRIDMAFGMGCAVTFVVTLSGTLTWLIDYYLLTGTSLEVTRYVCFILVIAGAVQLVEMYVRKFFPALYDSFHIPAADNHQLRDFGPVPVHKPLGHRQPSRSSRTECGRRHRLYIGYLHNGGDTGESESC
jgi:hypothetical protein